MTARITSLKWGCSRAIHQGMKNVALDVRYIAPRISKYKEINLCAPYKRSMPAKKFFPKHEYV